MRLGKPHTILKQPSPPRQENRHGQPALPATSPGAEQGAGGRRARREAGKSRAATPSSRRRWGRGAARGSHFSSPTIRRTHVPRADTLRARRSATPVTRGGRGATKPGAVTGWGAPAAGGRARVCVCVPLRERKKVSVVTAPGCGGEEAPQRD